MKKLLILLSACSLVYAETISEIQGIHHRSKYENMNVSNVRGVVTAILDTKFNKGFFMQNPNPDNDPRTSEGIYIENKTDIKPKVGDLVNVSGIVKEIQFTKANDKELTITSIHTDNVKIESKNNKISPTLIDGSKVPFNVHIGKGNVENLELDIKNNAMDYYESFESMLVSIKDPIVTGFAEKYAEIFVVPSYGKYTTNKTDLGGVRYSYENEQTQRISIAHNIIKIPKNDKLTDSNFTPNPGDKFKGDIKGIMTFSHNKYKVYNTESLPELEDGKFKRDTLKLKYDKDSLNVVSYNIENFTIADGQERLNELTDQLVNELQLPDIIGLVEVGDDDGGVKGTTDTDATKTIQAIVKSIYDKSKIQYGYLNINPEHGKDGGWKEMHIRNVILYRKDRLKLEYHIQGNTTIDTKVENKKGRAKLTYNPGRIGNNDQAFVEVRKPLVANLKFMDKEVYVLVNHLKSKRSDDKIFAKNRPVHRGSEIYRVPEARIINNFVNDILNVDDDSIVIVMGDMNDFQFSQSMRTLQGSILTNTIELLPEDQRYTYIYEGNAQVLDNVFVNNKYAKYTKVDIVNLNVGATKSQKYFSDHDPVFIQIKVK